MAAAANKRRRRRRKRPAPKFSKVAVTALLLAVAAFTITMIAVYVRTGGVPDTLIAAFFGFAGGEAGCLGLIKYSDNKYTSSSPPNGGGQDDSGGPVG